MIKNERDVRYTKQLGKIGIDDGMLDEVSELDKRCFGDDAFERSAQPPDVLGDTYVMQNNGVLIGYATYGQLWLPVIPNAYISRIGVHPQHRQQG